MFEDFLDHFIAFLPTMGFAVAILIGGFIFSKICIKLMSKGLSKSRIDPSAHFFLKSLVKVSLYCLVIVIVLTVLTVPMTSIIAVIGAAGLALALALQNSLSNLAGGFIILFAKPFKSGDYIESNNVSGTVQAISILYTRLLTPDNKAIYIPNGQISSATLINYNQENTRRLDLVFAISYSDDFSKAIDIIKDILENNSMTLRLPKPIVRVVEHGSVSLNIACKVWVTSDNYWNLHYDLLESVKRKFDESKITIPFNQFGITYKK